MACKGSGSSGSKPPMKGKPTSGAAPKAPPFTKKKGKKLPPKKGK